MPMQKLLKKLLKKLLLVPLITLSIISCTQYQVVEDISDTETVTGSDWSAKDLKKVGNKMANSISSSDLIQSPKYNMEKPRWMLAKELNNDTDEHINTRVIMEKIRTQLIKRRLARFIDDQALGDALNQLALQQSALFNNKKAAKVGKLVGAKLILRGRISNIRKRSNEENIVYYNITTQVVDLETLEIVWIDEAEIQRKTIKGKFR